METTIIENLEYYEVSNIIKFESEYCGKIKNKRDLIKIKNIDEENYIYARFVKNVWTKSDGLSKKLDKLFIKKIFIDHDINNSIKKDISEDVTEIIVIDDKHYYNSLYILNFAPIYCKNIRNGRELIKIKNILDGEFIFARKIKNVWILSSDDSDKHDKVLIRRSFIKKNKELYNELNEIYEEISNVEFLATNKKNVKYVKAPNIIKMEDNEKFKDDDNNILNIETRGDKKNYTTLYFKVEDVSVQMNKLNLSIILLNKKAIIHMVEIIYI